MSQTASCELVSSSSLDDLSSTVTNRMVEGWWPLGRPFIRGEQYIQAMKEKYFNDKHLKNILSNLPDGVYMYGHDHIQMCFELDNKLLINPGSCGNNRSFLISNTSDNLSHFNPSSLTASEFPSNHPA